MPKKQPRNAFYYFMHDFKEQQAKKGITYPNLAEVAKAAGQPWVEASPKVRANFEAIAKNAKMRKVGIEVKFTTTGVPISVIERQEQEKKDAEEAERKDIKNLIMMKSFNKSVVKEDIYIIDVNYYCKCGDEYLIGEFTILRFNVQEGIKDSYHELVNPGAIPVGYALDVKLGCQEFGLEMPDEGNRRSNYMQILATIIDYLKQKDRDVTTLPPLFTMPDKVALVADFIQQMCNRAHEDGSLFRVYRLDTLFFMLKNAINTNDDEGFPKESLALMVLKKDPFKYTPALGCEFHEEGDKSIECTSSRAKRWAYTILDNCCPIVGIEVVLGKHVPFAADMDSILAYRESKRERATTVATVANAASFNTSVASSSVDVDDSQLFHAWGDGSRKAKRVHVPLRMPTIDHAEDVRPPPELAEDNFPPLTSGSGRGRGLSGSFNKMNLRK